MPGKACPVCGSPMRQFLGIWKCVNVKAHDRLSMGAGKAEGVPGLRRKGGARKGAGRKKKKGK